MGLERLLNDFSMESRGRQEQPQEAHGPWMKEENFTSSQTAYIYVCMMQGIEN